MAKVKIMNEALLDITISRLCQQLIENHGDFKDSLILGLQPRGVLLADRIAKRIKELDGTDVSVGKLDITFHRDDFGRREAPLMPSKTEIPFLIEDKRVILVDDVLFTGRTVRAAMGAMLTFGRPKQVELLVLVDRKYSRDVPIEPTYIGKSVNSIQSQRVTVEWKETGAEEESVWLSLED
ncbi:bifunctional pyr operon transcriptional regulator/uracil phosphoribosyltransferase PyrR [Sediminitomix flava]|uniref:Pyrimidine operon attenuation protein/uracil phosphoribosyltransferase n=1 Tax=Sediminitomix flava TaxID=379075 RepID=A0A315ZG15_SEDFL|nr:bifunctional pyr operon transcriptional regulator/uracil phosphoribosyltransferase PyrR [Sediminitomix flava]PWJ44089.1 pyrimidine operon attenuation protein/uracil phosphoribosyltransferase [Sediminitomix flava]